MACDAGAIAAVGGGTIHKIMDRRSGAGDSGTGPNSLIKYLAIKASIVGSFASL
jgi:hypothetical protein